MMARNKSMNLFFITLLLVCLTSCNKKDGVTLLQSENAIAIINDSEILSYKVSLNNYDLFYPYQFPFISNDMDVEVVLYEGGTRKSLSLMKISGEKIKNYFVAFKFDDNEKSLEIDCFTSPYEDGSTGYLDTVPHKVSSNFNNLSTHFLENYQIVNMNETQYLGVVDFTGKEYSDSDLKEEVENSIQNKSTLITLEVKIRDAETL